MKELFWQIRLDVQCMTGAHRQSGPTKVFGFDERNLPYRTADEFHIYGAEWGEDYLKVYRDGKLTYHVTQDELGTDWVLNNPMEIWLDSEIFKWLGVPHKEELPVDFEIEYMRVWQKPNDNLLARQFFGFEGPILYEDQPRPLRYGAREFCAQRLSEILAD